MNKYFNGKTVLWGFILILLTCLTFVAIVFPSARLFIYITLCGIAACVVIPCILYILIGGTSLIINIIKEKISKRNTPLRKIDILSNEMFDGNMENAIRYVMKNLEGDEQYEYVKEFNNNEAAFASNVLYYMAVEKHGEKVVNQTVKAEIDLQFLEMTEDQIRNAKENPFCKDLKKAILKLLVVVLASGIMLGVSEFADESFSIIFKLLGGIFGVIGITSTAGEVTGSTMKCLKYRKLKKIYEYQ